jgi:hypothetical protein
MKGVDYRIPKEEYAFMHESRIRRELILKYDPLRIMKYLSIFPLKIAAMISNTCSI